MRRLNPDRRILFVFGCSTALAGLLAYDLIPDGIFTPLQTLLTVAALVPPMLQRDARPLKVDAALTVPTAAFLVLTALNIVHFGDAKLHQQLLLSVVMFAYVLRAADIEDIFDGLAVSAVGYAALTALMMILFPTSTETEHGRLIGPHGLNGTALAIAVLIPFVMFSPLSFRLRGTTIGVGLACIVLGAKTRTAMIVVASMVPFFAFLPCYDAAVRRSGRVLVAGGVVLGAVIAVTGEGLSFFTRGQSLKNLQRLSGRDVLVAAAIKRLTQDLWIGAGSKGEVETVWIRLFRKYYTTPGGSHNLFIGTGRTLGVFGIAAKAAVMLKMLVSVTLVRGLSRPLDSVTLRVARVAAPLPVALLLASMAEQITDRVVMPIGMVFWAVFGIACRSFAVFAAPPDDERVAVNTADAADAAVAAERIPTP